jgi:CTD small phosphatase-like protein 2
LYTPSLPPQNYYDFDPVTPFRYMLDVPPYECIAQKFLLTHPRLPCRGVLPRVSVVLDLDETLIHTEVAPIDDADFTFTLAGCDQPQTLHVRIRPHAELFLRTMAELFEVIVFTASERPYAEAVLRQLDPKGDLVEHVLCREDCTFIDGEFIKDLGGLSRDLSRTVLVDNRPEMYCYHTECGIPISSWFSDRRDCELLRLLPGLKHLASPACVDVRPYVRHRWRTHEEVTRVAKMLGRPLPIERFGSPSPRMTDASALSAPSPDNSPRSFPGSDDLSEEGEEGMFYDSGDSVKEEEYHTDEDGGDDNDVEEDGGGEEEGFYHERESAGGARPRLLRGKAPLRAPLGDVSCRW